MFGQTRILVGWGERDRVFGCVPLATGGRDRPAGTRLVLGWYSTDTRLALGWYSTGTRRTLGWHSTDTRLVLDWYSAGTRLVLDWYSTDTRRTLGWYSTDTRLARGWHSTDTRLCHLGGNPSASDLRLEAGLPRWKIESPSRSPRHPNSYVSSCKKFLCHCLLVTLGAVDGCERASFERF